MEKAMQERALHDYVMGSVNQFEEGWQVYERGLHKYLSNYSNFKDWTMQQNKEGFKYWLNLKTLEETVEHPG